MDAPDDDEQGKTIVMKLACLIAIYGALRGCELATLKFDSIKRENNGLVITIIPAKKRKKGEVDHFLFIIFKTRRRYFVLF